MRRSSVPKSAGMSSNGFGMADPFAAARSLNSQSQQSGPPQTAYPAAWHNSGPSSFPASGSMGVIGQAPAPAPFHSPPAAFPSAPMQQQPAPYGQQNTGGMQGAFGGFAPSGQTSGPPGIGFEDLASNPVAALAVHSGKQLMESSIAKYLPGALALWTSMRYYFHVDNNYVQRKLRLILFPFRHSKWSREQAPGAMDDARFGAPVVDVNSPDLYIPLMASVTYVLAMGLLNGIGMKFHPEILSQVMSTALVTLILEVCIVKAVLYVVGVGDVFLMDLVSYSGYKYVGLVVNLFVGIFGGQLAYYISLIYTGVCMAWFIINTFFPIVRTDYVQGGSSSQKSSSSQRNYAVIGLGAFQFILMWWLGSSSA